MLPPPAVSTASNDVCRSWMLKKERVSVKNGERVLVKNKEKNNERNTK